MTTALGVLGVPIIPNGRAASSTLIYGWVLIPTILVYTSQTVDQYALRFNNQVLWAET